MAYKIHHLNCATLCPSTRRLVNGEQGLLSLLKKGLLVCHCLLIETDQGLVLVDTGFSLGDIASQNWRHRLSFTAFQAKLDPAECALSQIRALGFRPQDVTDIILTHLDFDHAGGIKDFPHAKVHVYEKEFVGAALPQSLRQQYRYPADLISSHQNWMPHRFEGERWNGFERVNVLSDKQYDILLVPMLGHSIGHCGVAVSTSDGWLLHCGDAYFHKSEMVTGDAELPPALNAIENMIEYNHEDRIQNRDRLAALSIDPNNDITLFCSHDHDEFQACCHQPRLLGRLAV